MPWGNMAVRKALYRPKRERGMETHYTIWIQGVARRDTESGVN
jgi:hypothetical protein